MIPPVVRPKEVVRPRAMPPRPEIPIMRTAAERRIHNPWLSPRPGLQLRYDSVSVIFGGGMVRSVPMELVCISRDPQNGVPIPRIICLQPIDNGSHHHPRVNCRPATGFAPCHPCQGGYFFLPPQVKPIGILSSGGQVHPPGAQPCGYLYPIVLTALNHADILRGKCAHYTGMNTWLRVCAELMGYLLLIFRRAIPERCTPKSCQNQEKCANNNHVSLPSLFRNSFDKSTSQSQIYGNDSHFWFFHAAP